MFKIKKIKPTFNQLVVTRNLYTEERTESGLILGQKTNTIKEYQIVLETGPAVRGIEKGDVVFINPKRYMTIKHQDNSLKEAENNIIKDDMHAQFNIPTFTIYDGEGGKSREVMLIADNDIYLVAEGEEFDTNPTIMVDKKVLL